MLRAVGVGVESGQIEGLGNGAVAEALGGCREIGPLRLGGVKVETVM